MEETELKEKLSVEIKKLKSNNSNLKPYELFEKACKNLQFTIETYFREDISMIFLFSCQIILNNLIYINGSGETKEDSSNNAVTKFFGNTENNDKYFTDEINESIKSIDVCEDLVHFCKQFFREKNLSKFYKINYQTIKKELESHSQNKKLTENYRKADEEIICSIFLNNDYLLQQGKGPTEIEALENAAKELFISYDILPKESGNLEPKNQFNLKRLLGQLNNYLLEKHINTDYYASIKKFVENLNYKFEVKFNNGTTTIFINGLKVAEAKDVDEYCSNILACKNLVKEIRKHNLTEQIIPRQHSISTNSNVSSASNDLQVEENNISQKNVDSKFKNAAQMAKKECLANETLDIWSILNRCLKVHGISVEPAYEALAGNYSCSLSFKQRIIATGSDTNKELSRKAAAKNFIDKFL